MQNVKRKEARRFDIKLTGAEIAALNEAINLFIEWHHPMFANVEPQKAILQKLVLKEFAPNRDRLQ